MVCYSISYNYNSLINVVADDEFTYEFFKKAVAEGKLRMFGLQESDEELTIERKTDHSEISEIPDTDLRTCIWTQRKPTLADIEATEKLLDLRLKYADKYDDKKTTKQSLWIKIAEELKNEGFDLGNIKDSAEKCRQKFANLQKGYINFINHCKKTGNEKRNPPQFYEKLNSILGEKHKIFPLMTHDSLIEETNQHTSSAATSSDNLSNMEVDHDDECDTPNRYSTAKKRVKPTKENNFIETIKDMNKEAIKVIIESNERTHQLLQEQNKLLEIQNQQREKLVNAFIDLVQTKKK